MTDTTTSSFVSQDDVQGYLTATAAVALGINLISQGNYQRLVVLGTALKVKSTGQNQTVNLRVTIL